MMIFSLLLVGAAGAGLLIAITFLLSRFTREIFARLLLVSSLSIAAGAYFAFAIGAGAGPVWVLVELVQVVGFGTVAVLGLRGSPYWIAAGWALHPVWDIGVHYAGPGHSFAPVSYAIACGSFDFVVAAYIAIAYGLVGRRKRFHKYGSVLRRSGEPARNHHQLPDKLKGGLTGSEISRRISRPF